MILNFGGKTESNELESGPKIVSWQPFAHAQKEILSSLAEPTFLRRSERDLTRRVGLVAKRHVQV